MFPILFPMPEEVALNGAKDIFPDEAFKELLEAGVFYGRKKSKANPKMRPYILMNRGGIEIINLSKTVEGMEKAAAFVKEKIQAGGLPLFAATQPPASGVIDFAKRSGFPYVANRWVGGSLTNFKVISRRIEEFKKLRADLASGALSKYTKKERLTIEREVGRLRELLGGLENLSRLPDALIVIDPELHNTAVREAIRLHIPIVAFANVDADPDAASYLVVGNTKAARSIEWFLKHISQAIEEGRRAIPDERPPAEAEAVKTASAI